MRHNVETALQRSQYTLVYWPRVPEAGPPFSKPIDQSLAGSTSLFFKHMSYVSGTSSASLQISHESLEKAFSDFIDPAGYIYALPAKASSTEESPSLQHPIPEVIERSVDALFDAANDEEFEYGFTSRLASALSELIQKHGIAAVEAIGRHIAVGDVRVDSVIEALHTLARVQHTPSRSERLLLLLRNLFANSARIRSGAAIGLAYLDDPKALSFLRQALDRESSKSTRVCFQRVIEQLVDTERNG